MDETGDVGKEIKTEEEFDRRQDQARDRRQNRDRDQVYKSIHFEIL